MEGKIFISSLNCNKPLMRELSPSEIKQMKIKDVAQYSK